MGDVDIGEMSFALPSFEALAVLGLSEIQIRIEGAKAIAEALKFKAVLTKLNLHFIALNGGE